MILAQLQAKVVDYSHTVASYFLSGSKEELPHPTQMLRRVNCPPTPVLRQLAFVSQTSLYLSPLVYTVPCFLKKNNWLSG